MSQFTYLDRLRHRRLGRRALLRASARAGVGAAGLALVGCGDDDDDDEAAAQTQVDETTDQQADQAVDQETDQTEEPADTTDEPAPSEGGIQRGGTVRAVWPIEDSHLDPHISREHFSALLWRTVSNGILGQEPVTHRPTADLAQDWENPEPTVFVFNLHPNIRFHDKPPVDGRAFTAEDAVYSFERMSARLEDGSEAGTYPRASSFTPVTAFEAPDEQTFRIVTDAPFAPLLNFVANKWSVIVAREVVDQFGDLRSGDTAIGVGPFVAEEANNVRGARVVRNPNYHIEGLPYLDAIEWTVVTDTSAQEAAYVSGQSDIYGQFGIIPGVDLPRFAERDDTTIHEFQTNSFGLSACGGPNTKEPLNELRVRQAINLPIDRADLGRIAFPGSELQEGSFITSPLWGLPSDEVVTLPGWGDKEAERQEARQLLDAAGYPDGFTLVINTTEAYAPYHIDRSVTIQPHLAAIGIDSELNILEFGALKEQETAGDFQFTTASYAFADDPDSQLFNAFHTDGSRNYWANFDPVYDELVEDQRRELDLDARIEKVKEIQRYLHETVPVAADDWYRLGHWATKTRLQNFQAGSTIYHFDPKTWWLQENV